MMTEKKLSIKKKKLFYLLLFLITVVSITIIYVGVTTYRTKQFYTYVKTNQRGWSGKVHEAHRMLGFRPIPDAEGAEVMPVGPPVLMRYDKDGFRVPIVDIFTPENVHPMFLALGCSFTYGAATHAKDTFPYLVGKYTGGGAKNAGVCSYGLSQMVIIAKELIPQHKPDYVIVQYSPWLVERAVRHFAPSYYGKIPNPYFIQDDNLKINPPVFQTKVFALSFDYYRNSQVGIPDFFSFLLNVGFPLFLHDDFNMAAYTINKVLRLEKRPTKNLSAVIHYAYNEIFKITVANDAKFIIVILGEDQHPVPIPKDLFPPEALIIDAHGELISRLPAPDEHSYQKRYGHWRGDPPSLVDSHPNEYAHKVIAEKIVSQITGSLNKTN
jgi:hypothetical protein